MSICDEIRSRLTLYLDDELQGDEKMRVEAHLGECATCREYVDSELRFLDAVRNAQPLHVASSQLRERVEQILVEPSASPPITRRDPEVVPSAVAAFVSTKRGWAIAVVAGITVLLLPVIAWRFTKRAEGVGNPTPSRFALMASETHLRRTRGQLPLEIITSTPQQISDWFGNKVNFHVQLPNYQESSGQEKLYTLEGARLIGYENDYAAYVAYQMKTRPISLIITSAAVARPSGGEEIKANGLTFHYDGIQGLKVITWSDRGLTYALVSDFEERGQQTCIVCHQGTKDQDLIAPLRLQNQER